MKRMLILMALTISCLAGSAQATDTLQVQKNGSKMFVVILRQQAPGDATVAYDTFQVVKMGDRMVVLMQRPALADVPPPVAATSTRKKIEDHFMIAGLGTVGFGTYWTKNAASGVVTNKNIANSFGDAAHFEFSPMFIWRHGTHLLIEFEPSFTGNSIGVNWANISYFLPKSVCIHAGFFVVPFGAYNKKMAAGWINKLVTDPISIRVNPASDWGLGLSGAIQAGKMKFNYDFSVTNGYQLQPDGSLANPSGSGIVDNNLGKMVAGRIGWLPISNSSLEIGISGLYSGIGDGNSVYKKPYTGMGAVDINYVNTFSPVTINIKGQYNMAYVNKQNYINPFDTSQRYTFSNVSSGYYAMLSLRASQGPKFIKSLEFAGRYARYTSPQGSLWEQDTHQITAGVAYWLTWRSVIKVGYERLIQTSGDNAPIGLANGKILTDALIVQYSVQF
jgi:hypothetical protein